jgi:hypothetical protein
LRPVGAILVDSDLGTFIKLKHRDYSDQKLLFLRGVKLDYIPKQRGWLIIFYLNPLCEQILQNVVFTSLIDDENNVYLIDKNGNTLKYETVSYTGEHYLEQINWRIYANDKMRVKIYGELESSEILTDVATVGKHTKPALRAIAE